MDEKVKPCLVSCSVLEEELENLVKEDDLMLDLVLVSKVFNVDYQLLEKHLQKVIEKSLSYSPEEITLVYIDFCRG